MEKLSVHRFKVYGIEKNPWTLLKMSCSYTVSTVRMVWTSLVGLLTGKYGLNDMAGPIGAAQAIAQSASQGLSVNVKTAINNILLMMTIITVNLGIVNSASSAGAGWRKIGGFC